MCIFARTEAYAAVQTRSSFLQVVMRRIFVVDLPTFRDSAEDGNECVPKRRQTTNIRHVTTRDNEDCEFYLYVSVFETHVHSINV
jgi:hypothetical protein